MDRDVDRDTVRDTYQDPTHTHPGKPEQTEDEGFERGYEQVDDPRHDEAEPNFARGISEEPPGEGKQSHFARGIQEDPDAPDANVEGRFSKGIEGTLQPDTPQRGE